MQFVGMLNSRTKFCKTHRVAINKLIRSSSVNHGHIRNEIIRKIHANNTTGFKINQTSLA